MRRVFGECGGDIFRTLDRNGHTGRRYGETMEKMAKWLIVPRKSINFPRLVHLRIGPGGEMAKLYWARYFRRTSHVREEFIFAALVIGGRFRFNSFTSSFPLDEFR